MVLMCKRAESFGVDSDMSPWLLSITSLSEIVAQLSSGAFADRGLVRRIHLHKVFIFLFALILFVVSSIVVFFNISMIF